MYVFDKVRFEFLNTSIDIVTSDYPNWINNRCDLLSRTPGRLFSLLFCSDLGRD